MIPKILIDSNFFYCRVFYVDFEFGWERLTTGGFKWLTYVFIFLNFIANLFAVSQELAWSSVIVWSLLTKNLIIETIAF